MSHRPGRMLEITVDRLGAAGDGVALLDGQPLYLPFALPGERWQVRLESRQRGSARAAPVELLAPSGERAQPVCPHFGTCGGCRLQHLEPAAYRRFGRTRIIEALRAVGLAHAPVGEALVSPLGSRRRVRLAWDGRRLGFRGLRGRGVMAIHTCPIAAAPIVAALAPLAAALADLPPLRPPSECSLTLTEEGLDLLLDGLDPPELRARETLARLAEMLDLARIAIVTGAAPEPVVTRRPPVVTLGKAAVEMPPGGFLQATREGERALQERVTGWLGEAAHIVDLYAGIGTLTLPTAHERRRLTLLESDLASVAAVMQAARRVPLPGVAAVRRDLERDPLTPIELADYDAAVLDPPRAGAAAQARALAASALPRLVYASCHPGSFARDARLLVDGGFALREVQPVDQFLFSPHIELIALFERERGPACPT